MRQITLSTAEYQTETAARRALQALLLQLNGSETYVAQRSPTFGTILDKFITDEHLQEIMARRPGEVVDEGLKYSTTTGYLSVIKLAFTSYVGQRSVDRHQGASEKASPKTEIKEVSA